jgi:hypothetical protein
MDADRFELIPSLKKMTLETLEDFEVVGSYGSGAILYSAAYRNVNGLGRNLEAVSAAAALGLSSLDYARRRYVSTDDEPSQDATQTGYVAAYKAARRHIDQCANAMLTNPDVELGFGTYAASIALERLQLSFGAAHLLYNLGLHYEGDVIARQILEQIAWSVAASQVMDEDKLERISSSASIPDLKVLAPAAGRLNGYLSKSAHLGLAQHRQVFQADVSGRGRISMTWNRTRVSADILLSLADLWAIAYEWTQRAHMTTFVSLDPEANFHVDAKRSFLGIAKKLLDDIPPADEKPDVSA